MLPETRIIVGWEVGTVMRSAAFFARDRGTHDQVGALQ